MTDYGHQRPVLEDGEDGRFSRERNSSHGEQTTEFRHIRSSPGLEPGLTDTLYVFSASFNTHANWAVSAGWWRILQKPFRSTEKICGWAVVRIFLLQLAEEPRRLTPVFRVIGCQRCRKPFYECNHSLILVEAAQDFTQLHRLSLSYE